MILSSFFKKIQMPHPLLLRNLTLLFLCVSINARVLKITILSVLIMILLISITMFVILDEKASVILLMMYENKSLRNTVYRSTADLRYFLPKNTSPVSKFQEQVVKVP